jgi:hypothetical protein
MSYALPPKGFDDMTEEEVTADSQPRGALNKLPQPGERHNASGIPVSDRALGVLLAAARLGELYTPCNIVDCEACNEFHLIWWDCCNALSRRERLSVQSWLTNTGHGMPDAPWEDTAADGTPLRSYVRPDRA